MATMIDAPPAGALAAAKAYLRIERDDEDDLLGMLIAAAIGIAERFTGCTLLIVEASEAVDGGRCHPARLRRAPVTAIGAVTAADGSALPVDVVRMIAASGDGFVGADEPVLVTYSAGLAAEWAGLPAAIRQGVVRLVAHLHAHRDEGDGAGPPAAVTALWRPYRRMRL